MKKTKGEVNGTANMPKGYTTISKKLSTRIVAVVMVMVIVILGSALYLMRYITETKSKEQIAAESDAYAGQVEAWTNGILSELNTVKATIQNGGFKDDDAKLLAYLKSVTLTLDDNLPVGVYLGGADNRYVDPTDFVVTADYIVAERGWYKLGLTVDTMTFGDPYIGENLGKLMVSASSKIDDTNVVSSDIVLDSITEIVDSLDIVGDGTGFIIDSSSGYMVAHKNTDYDGVLLSDIDDPLVQEVSADATNVNKVYSLTADGTKYFVDLVPIENTNWVLAVCSQQSVLMASLNRITAIYCVAGALLLFILAMIVFLSIKKTTSPLDGLTNVITSMTAGDFTVEPEVKGNDEIAIMSMGLESFILKMRSVISELGTISDELNKESVSTSDVSSSMSDTADSQESSMKQMNTTVEELAKSITDIAENATSLANTVSDVDESSKSAMNKMNATVEVTRGGKDDMERVLGKMKNIDQVMRKLDEVVEEVGNSTKEINNITTIIGDIASQTNLLALNASIEAARAGEAGKGFAVVATEIGNLASMSADAVKKIEDLINKISTQVDEVVTRTSQSVGDVAESMELLDNTNATFNSIYTDINETNEMIRNVTEKIAEVDEVATNMAAITQEQSAGTEEISATSENLYSQSVQVSESSKSIRNTAKELGSNAEKIYNNIREFIVG